jgi:peptidoglycan L-alanyl-D-glutamate endopeptidase CwlK
MALYTYGRISRSRLETVDPLLQEVFQRALNLGLIDITILQGVRSRQLQDQYYREGKSKVRWPNSKHNVKTPEEKSKAVDAGPYVEGKASYAHTHCCYLAGIVQAVARSMGVEIRWGGNWDMDGEPITDQDFQDLVHYELVGGKS